VFFVGYQWVPTKGTKGKKFKGSKVQKLKSREAGKWLSPAFRPETGAPSFPPGAASEHLEEHG
jgi:hypothetical protein